MSFDPNVVFDLVIEGYRIGGLIGLVMGVIAWTVTDKGTHAIAYMFVGFILGLGLGIAFEGRALLAVMRGGGEGMLESSEYLRGLAFKAIVDVSSWVFGFMALGAAVAGLKRAIVGAGLGLVMGGLAALLLLLARVQFNFVLTDSLLTIMVAILSLVLMTILSLGSADKG